MNIEKTTLDLVDADKPDPSVRLHEATSEELANEVPVKEYCKLLYLDSAGMFPRKRALFRSHLPYGKWTCRNGREILFNRNYHPIWQRYHGGAASMAHPLEWVKDIISLSEHYYDDSDAPHQARPGSTKARKRCFEVLAGWGVPFPEDFAAEWKTIDQEERFKRSRRYRWV